jgi:dinuclear metal center YbgI/SA1388 family protein
MKRDNLKNKLSDIYNVFIDDVSLNGLQIEGRDDIKSAACAVSANLQTIEAAVSQNVDALIVHHGLFWKGQQQTLTGSHLKKVKTLLQANISLFAYHIPMDLHEMYGNNYPILKLLNGQLISQFAFYKGSGCGLVFDVDTVHVDHILNKLSSIYQCEPINGKIVKDNITRVAVCSGAGHKSMHEIIDMNVDLFVTGTLDEPNWHMAIENEINFVAYGHCNSEKIGPKLLAEGLSQKTDINAFFIDDTNPY